MDYKQAVFKPKRKYRRRADAAEKERRLLSKASKAMQAEGVKTRVYIGKENLPEWHRQKALCGLATSPHVEFVRHLLSLHQDHCAMFNHAVLDLGTEARY